MTHIHAGGAEFKGQRTSQTLWFLSSVHFPRKNLSRKRPFFVIYYLRLYLQQMRLVVLGLLLACRTTLATANSMWGILTDKLPRDMYLVCFEGAMKSS